MSTNATTHRLIHGDARDLSFLPAESIHLVVTSPPYWNLKRYNEHDDQLGHIDDYEEFLDELEKVWRHVFRVLVPGGRLVCVVGDVCVSRRRFGRHLVFPLHADISVRCRKIGFDNLNPIIWHKIANASYEVPNGSKFLGKPYEPNAIIKNDIEYILMQRKPGGYRQPTNEQRRESKIDKKDFDPSKERLGINGVFYDVTGIEFEQACAKCGAVDCWLTLEDTRKAIMTLLAKAKGHWTKEPPTEPGWYIAYMWSFKRGFPDVSAMYLTPNEVKLKVYPVWVEQWWSEPISLPEPPEEK